MLTETAPFVQIDLLKAYYGLPSPQRLQSELQPSMACAACADAQLLLTLISYFHFHTTEMATDSN